MVNLPSPEDQVRVGGSSEHLPRSHHNWGARFGRRRDDPKLRAEPTSLDELDQLAARTVQLMEKHGPKFDGNYSIAMDLLRLQYNLNFKMVCKKCSESDAHPQDELTAPER